MEPVRKIRWEYWQHPLGGSREWVPEDEARPSEYMGADHEDDDGDEVEDGFVRPDRLAALPVLIPTSAGLVPTKIAADTTKAFDFWTGHANFNISEEVLEEIEEFPGVETLDVLTRYRFKVGFGKAFAAGGWNTSRIRRGIERLLGADPSSRDGRPDVDRAIVEVESEAREKGQFWALLALPNGSVDFVRSGDDRAVVRRLADYVNAKTAVGGEVYYDL